MMDPKKHPYARLLTLALITIMVIFIAGCAGGEQNAAPTATAADGTVQPPPEPVGPLAPALVEVTPLPDSQLPLSKEITFYFNQPMNRATVEAALVGTPALNGTFTWVDTSTLTFAPAQPWAPNAALTITIGTSAESQDGLTFEQPVTLHYTTADYLRLTEMLPTENATEVAPESAIVVSFNEPVVALGTDAALPDAFTLDPAVQGRGEWLNTSTYVFYPEPALFGGTMYTVRVNPSLQSTGGTGQETGSMWSFHTLEPGYTAYSPQRDALHVRLDEPVVITFNQAMNTDSVAQAFSMVDEDQQPVTGVISWSDDLKEMTFTPDELYGRGKRYTFTIPAGVQSLGGAVLPVELKRNFYAAMDLFVLSTNPASGGQLSQYSPVEIEFNAPIDVLDPLDYITVDPEVRLTAGYDQNKIYLYGNFEAEQTYTITVSGAVTDIWGDDLEFDYPFSFTGAPLNASFTPFIYQGFGLVYTNPDQPVLTAQMVNIDSAIVKNGLISFNDYLYLQHTAGYDERQAFTPPNITQTTPVFDVARNRNEIVPIDLNGGSGFVPGIYWISIGPQPAPQYSSATVAFVVASHVQMVYKSSPTEALVWAMDRRTQSPVSGQQVVIYDTTGAVLGSGLTDATGLFTAALSEITASDSNVTYAVLGNPGEEFFSVASSVWNEGITSYDFGLSSDFTKPQNEYYLYTDRPIYRPGDEIFFRVVARQAQNGRYQLPVDELATVAIFDYTGTQIDSITLAYSEYGTAEGSFTLPEFTEPGYYDLVAQDKNNSRSVSFQVADYRKPEIDLELSFGKLQYLAGEQINAEIASRYFFDAPASGVTLTWNLYAQDTRFSLPGYQVGPVDDFYHSPYMPGGSLFGDWQTGGDGTTGDDGSFAITAPTKITDRTQSYTLEVIMQDESGYPVASRTSVTVHPSLLYIGVRPNNWIGQVDSEMDFDLQVVDWDGNPTGVQTLTATFGRVTWERGEYDNFGNLTYDKQVDVRAQGEFPTNASGQALLPFTPDEPGVYQLEVRSGSAVTQVLFWVGGPGTAQWPDLISNQVTLLSSADSFAPGEVGSVYIPNPFDGPVYALVTTERGEIMSSQIIQITGAGMNLPVSFTNADAPNIYLTATLIGTESDGTIGFRYGMVNLPVDASAYKLNVEVVGQPERTGPGETVSFTIQVTDASGAPVQAEFSLSIVDEALLALADPVEKDIFSAFYSEHPLGVRTGISLAAAAEIYLELPPGLGGGGGADQAPPSVRSDFQDTAYWNGTIVTGADGTATVEAVLPDNLTTWRVLARGITADSRAGEAVSEVITTLPLIVRPVMPRFAVAGDHFEAAAVVQNNTDQDLEVVLTITASGFVLDDQNSAAKTVNLPAQSRVRVGWWGTAEQVDQIEVTFSGQGGEYSDSTTPTQGAVPVVGYTAPQAFVTAGVLDMGEERLELVSLPRSFEPQGGLLRLEMSPSLAGIALDVQALLEEEDSYDTTEALVTSFLPDLEMYLALQEFGLDTPGIEDAVNAKMRASINQIEATQNFDGGWSWFSRVGNESNPQVSAYVLLGLIKAEQAGYPIRTYVRDYAVQYLTDYILATPPQAQRPWQYDQAAFIYYVLAQTETPLVDQVYSLLNQKENLNPWGQALVGLTLLQFSDAEQVTTIFSDLQATAVRTASGVYWEETGRYWQNISSNNINTAVVLYALAQIDPASPMVADGVRYLMTMRDAQGGWYSPYATAWALMAITEVMSGTGELGGDFAFSATLNNVPFAEGTAGGAQQFNQVVATAGLDSLLADLPNALNIQRDPGTGRLYYRAVLDVAQPVETITALNRGIGVSRVYYNQADDCRAADCQPVTVAQVGDLLTVHVTLNLENDANYLAVEDYIPAGTEILNLNLQTSQLGQAEQGQQYLPEDPFSAGWGWWYFNSPQVYDDHISWVAEYLPAGTYELTYTLVVLQPGSYRVIPAQARLVYFPDVQGVSDGIVFEITQ